MTSENKKLRRGPYRPRWPWESYGPEWKELWLKGSREAFHIDFPNQKRLNSTRLRAQHYRKMAQERNEEGWNLLYRATTHEDPVVAFRLHFLPVEEPHKEAFAQAGIIVEEAPLPPPLRPGEATASPAISEMDQAMIDLLKEKEQSE